ncbi:MAG: acyltransferase [Pseudomonadota bacterium]
MTVTASDPLTTTPERKSWAIQSLRGIAATMVGIMHIIGFASRGGNDIVKGWHDIAKDIGPVGVDIFFVISGFIITLLFRRNQHALVFLIKRFARVYIIYWITLAALVAFYAYRGFMPPIDHLIENPKVLLLLSTAKAHPVSWTLVYEIHLYAVAAFALLFRRHAMTVLVIWCFLQLYLVALAGQRIIPFYVFFHPLSLEFVLGIMVGLLVDKFRLPKPGLFIVLGLVFPFAFNTVLGDAISMTNGYMRVLAWGVPSAILVFAALQWERTHDMPSRALNYLGDISYSFYLWHWLIAAMMTLVIPGLTASLFGAVLYIVVTIALVTAVSAVSYQFVERPVNIWVATLTRNIGKPTHSAPQT